MCVFFCPEAEFVDFSSESSFSGPGSHFLSATTNTRWLFVSPVVPVTPFPSPEARDRQQSSPSPQVESQTPSEDENSTMPKNEKLMRSQVWAHIGPQIRPGTPKGGSNVDPGLLRMGTGRLGPLERQTTIAYWL